MPRPHGRVRRLAWQPAPCRPAQLTRPEMRFEIPMTKTLALPICALLATVVLAAAPSSAGAQIPIRVGIGDQQVTMFDQPLFQARKFKLVRYFVPWNVEQNKDELALATAYVQRARRDNIQVLLHISSDDLRIKRARLPSVAQYRTQIKKIVATFRPLGVRDFGAWNEVNQAIQPKCSFCNVVALDVLDQVGVQAYMRSFYRHLSSTYRQRATLVGIHNYGDVNRQRTTFTKNIISQSREFNKNTRFWFTETGGLVKFGLSFPCNKERARNRLKNMFSLARTYRTSGVERLYVYNFTGPADGCDARFDAGLTNFNGTARPGYNYLKDALPNYER